MNKQWTARVSVCPYVKKKTNHVVGLIFRFTNCLIVTPTHDAYLENDTCIGPTIGKSIVAYAEHFVNTLKKFWCLMRKFKSKFKDASIFELFKFLFITPGLQMRIKQICEYISYLNKRIVGRIKICNVKFIIYSSVHPVEESSFHLEGEF